MATLATHQSLTYGALKNWWFYPLKFMGACQFCPTNIETQYEKYGVRYFDIRINARRDDILETAHGFLRFKVDIDKVMEYLNSKGDCFVRLVLEESWEKKNQEEYDKIFQKHCEYLEKTYPNITFLSGQRKYDGKQLYDFKTQSPSIVELYSSVTSLFNSDNKFLRVIDDWFPFLYAFIKNKKNYKRYKDSTEYEYLMMDFIAWH